MSPYARCANTRHKIFDTTKILHYINTKRRFDTVYEAMLEARYASFSAVAAIRAATAGMTRSTAFTPGAAKAEAQQVQQFHSPST